MITTTARDLTEVPDVPAGLAEIDARSFDGITVRLLWSPATNEVFVQRIDAKASGESTFETFHLIPGEHARYGFDHPTAFPTVPLR